LGEHYNQFTLRHIPGVVFKDLRDKAYPCLTDLVSILEVLDCLMMFRDVIRQIPDHDPQAYTLILL
jgi:hypothetical protein